MNTFTPRLDILPAAQRQLWHELRPIQDHGYVLYGGTAIALRLGHRHSVDFDFFTRHPVNREALREALPFVRIAEVKQDRPNTFEIVTRSQVKVSFFGGLDFGRVGTPAQTQDGVLVAASLQDLMATKLKVILQRSAAKDYQDIAAMVREGVSVSEGLAAAERMFKPTFPPAESLRAMVYFKEGDLAQLKAADRKVLIEAAAGVKMLPEVSVEPDLSAGLKLAPSQDVSIRPEPRAVRQVIDEPVIRPTPRQDGPRMSM